MNIPKRENCQEVEKGVCVGGNTQKQCQKERGGPKRGLLNLPKGSKDVNINHFFGGYLRVI